MGAAASAGAIGPYEILRQLPGQSREIYVARRHGDASGRVVLATFELRAEDARWLDEEVERCRQLNHEAITRIVDSFEHDGKHVIVFEAVRGAALSAVIAHLLKEGERVADGAVHYLAEMLFGALATAHHQTDEDGRRTIPLVHGQLGPHQIFISWEGEVKLLGFGLSRVFRLAQGVEAAPEEARPFLSPEARAGSAASTRSNVYTAAAMLWSLYARALPPEGEERLPLLRARRPDMPRELADAIDQALEPLVVRRGMTAAELAKAFEGRGGTEGRRELRWNVEVLRGLDTFADDLPLPTSFPPAALSTAPRPPPDDELRPSQRNPAVPTAPPLPVDGLGDEPTANPDGGLRGPAGSQQAGSKPARSAPHDSLSPISSSNMPTQQWPTADVQGMRQLFETVQAQEIDEATEIETVDEHLPAAGSSGASPAPPAVGSPGPVPRPAAPAVPPPGGRAGQRNSGQGKPAAGKAGHGKRARARTLVGVGNHATSGRATGVETNAEGELPDLARRMARAGGQAQQRVTLPGAGVKPRATSPAGANGGPVGTDANRSEGESGGSPAVVARLSRPFMAGRIGPPAIEARAEGSLRHGADPRVDESEPPVQAATTPGSPLKAPPALTPLPARREFSARAGGGPSLAAGRAFGLPPPPELPKVLVVAEAVRPSVRPPGGRAEAAPNHSDGGAAGIDRPAERPRGPLSVRPRGPRSRASRLRSHAEGPVSGRLVSVRPVAAEPQSVAGEPSPTLPVFSSADGGHDGVGTRGPAPWPGDGSQPALDAAEVDEQRAPQTERAPTAGSPDTGASASDAPAVLNLLRRGTGLVPTRWVVSIAAVIAVTAIVSFAAGLLVASGPLDVRVAAEASAQPRADSSSGQASPTPGPGGPSAEPAQAATAAATSGSTSEPSASAPYAAPTDTAGDDGDDGSTLPDGFGYLLVRSSADDAHVYVSGSPVGPTGKKLLVRCGLLHVRLAGVPLKSWFSPGKAVSVVCQGVTAVLIEPGKKEPAGSMSGAGHGPSTRFVPDEL